MAGSDIAQSLKKHNSIHRRVKRSSNTGIACYHSVQNHLSARLLYVSSNVQTNSI
jgi:hypothetical protein